MKTAQRTVLAILVLALVGSAIVLPLRYHMVVFDGKTHIVQKESLGWDNTFLNLDKDPLKRRYVLQSKTLRAYFAKYYAKQMVAWTKKNSKSLLQRFGEGAKKVLKRSGKWLKEKGAAHVKSIGKKAKEGIKLVKEKGKQLIQQAGQ